MTGFGSAAGEISTGGFQWEVRSVNARGLDVRLRCPPRFEALEPELRMRLKSHLHRGAVQASLAVGRSDRRSEVRVDAVALDAAAAVIETVRARIETSPPTPEGVLAMRGVLVTDEPDDEVADDDAAAILAAFDVALGRLRGVRETEGGSVATVLGRKIEEIETLSASAAEAAVEQTSAIRARLRARVAELAASDVVSDERLEEEIVMAAIKGDVAEELDRIAAHVAAARALLAEGGAVGRQLDFLCQEFNREANTLCAKAQTTRLKRIGLDMKVVVDQVREQVQNVE